MRNEPARGHEPGQGAVLSALRSVPPSSSLSSGLSLVRGALRLQETSRLRGVRPVCPFWPPHAVGSGLCSAHRHGPMDCLSHRPPPLCLCRLGLARGGLVAGGNEAPDGLPLWKEHALSKPGAMELHAERQGGADARPSVRPSAVPSGAASRPGRVGPSRAGFRWLRFRALDAPQSGRRTYAAENSERGDRDACACGPRFTAEPSKRCILCSSRCRIHSECDV